MPCAERRQKIKLQQCSKKGVKCYLLHIPIASSDCQNFVVRSHMSNRDLNLLLGKMKKEFKDILSTM